MNTRKDCKTPRPERRVITRKIARNIARGNGSSKALHTAWNHAMFMRALDMYRAATNERGKVREALRVRLFKTALRA
jgi:hypothetical protein